MKINTFKLLLALLLSTLIVTEADAQAGLPDPHFLPADSTNFIYAYPNAFLTLPDGRIVVGGGDRFFQTIGCYRPDGIADPSFKVGRGFDNQVEKLALTKDGKILAGGYLSSYNGQPCGAVACLNTDGSLNSSFHCWHGMDSAWCTALKVQADGKIVVGTSRPPYLVRLNSDGSLDNSFDIQAGFTDRLNGPVIHSIAQQPDGSLLIGGLFTGFNHISRVDIVRLFADGTLDNSFVADSSFFTGQRVSYLALQADGKMLVGLRFSTNALGNLIRLNADGSLDSTYLAYADYSITAMSLQKDGKLIVGCYSAKGIARLNTDGTEDTAFHCGQGFYEGNTGGFGGREGVTHLEAQPNGDILVAGDFSYYNRTPVEYMLRIESDGLLDSNFIIGSGLSREVSTIAVLPDDQLLVGGAFKRFGTTLYSNIAKLTKDGTPDPTFKAPNMDDFSEVYVIRVQPDGKIIAGGYFTIYGNRLYPCLIRLNANGTIDTTFRPDAAVIGNLYNVPSLAIQQDGKIVVGMNYYGLQESKVIRLNTDGSIDPDFMIGSGASIGKVQLSPDGKIIVSGAFDTFNGQAYSGLVKLNKDGSVDESFKAGKDGNWLETDNLIQPDGKLIVIRTKRYSGEREFVRYLPDGSRDSTFKAVATGEVSLAALQPDGKILCKTFSRVDELYYSQLSRLNADGSIDNGFHQTVVGESSGPSRRGIGINCNSFAFQSDSKIIVGGSFTQVDEYKRNHLMRLYNCMIMISPQSLAPAVVGMPYSAPAFKISQGKVHFAPGSKKLPDGLSLDANSGIISGTPATTGDFTFDVVATNGSCTDTFTFHILIDADLIIYPNPTSALLHIKFGPVPKGLYNIAIYDVLGRTTLSTSKDVSNSLTELTLDISRFASGSYFLCIEHTQKSRKVKLLKL